MTRKGGNLRWWIATLGMAAGVCVGVALGCWQLDRAAQKSRWHAAQQAQSSAPALTVQEVQATLQSGSVDAAQWLHRVMQLQGYWLPEHTVYLDNRQMQGRPGFYVLTPLQLSQGGVVLVQRGWIARNFQDRQALQPVQTPQGAVTVQGLVAGAPARLYALGDGDMPDAHNPRIRQNLDLQAFARSTGLPLWPITVVQTGAASEGLLRDWPQAGSGVATHYGYAFQWFAMAAVLAAMLLWFQWIRPLRLARRCHVIEQH